MKDTTTKSKLLASLAVYAAALNAETNLKQRIHANEEAEKDLLLAYEFCQWDGPNETERKKARKMAETADVDLMATRGELSQQKRDLIRLENDSKFSSKHVLALIAILEDETADKTLQYAQAFAANPAPHQPTGTNGKRQAVEDALRLPSNKAEDYADGFQV